MFQTGFLSIIRSLVLYEYTQLYIQYAVYTALDSYMFSVHHESSTVYTAVYTVCCVYSTRPTMMDRKPVRNM